MINGFLVKKTKMTQVYNSEGHLLAATVCKAEPMKVLAFPQAKRVRVQQHKTIREFGIVDSAKQPNTGEEITIDQVFSVGESLRVTGTSKGRGFAGVIKRWGFHRQPRTRGQSDRERAPGSIGAQTPGKVVRGKKMPGHYGHQTITISGLTLISIDKEKSEVLVSGSLPGHIKSSLVLRKTQ